MSKRKYPTGISQGEEENSNLSIEDNEIDIKLRPINFIGNSANGDEFFEGIIWQDVNEHKFHGHKRRTRNRDASEKKRETDDKPFSVRLGDCVMVMLEGDQNLSSMKSSSRKSNKSGKCKSNLIEALNSKLYNNRGNQKNLSKIESDDESSSESSFSAGHYFAPAEILFIWRDNLEDIYVEVRWLFDERDVLTSRLPLTLSQNELVETDSVSQIPVEAINSKIFILSYDEYQRKINGLNHNLDTKENRNQTSVNQNLNITSNREKRTNYQKLDKGNIEKDEQCFDDDEVDIDVDTYFIRLHYSTKYRCTTSLNIQNCAQRRQRALSYSLRGEDCPSSLLHEYKVDEYAEETSTDISAQHQQSRKLKRNREPKLISGKERLDIAEELLHATTLPTFLPCREGEWEEIKGWIQASIKGALGQALYICGAPGTGKTATVLVTMRTLREARDRGEIPSFRFVEINALKLSNPNEAYTVLHEAVFRSQRKKTPQSAREDLVKYFSKSVENKPVVVVLLDEMDYLVTQNQKVLYTLIGEWPRMKYSKLVVVGISNTFDLLERAIPRTQSRIGINRINFMPYQHEQIARILHNRLSLVKGVLSDDAINLCSRKTASNLGDVRKAFQLSRLAINRCRHRMELLSEERDWEAKTNNLNTKKTDKRPSLDYIVSSGDMREADRELNDTPLLQAIRNSTFTERVVLVAMASQIYASGCEYAIAQRIKERTDQIIAQEISLGRSYTSPCYADILLLLEKFTRQGLVNMRTNLTLHWSPIISMHVEPITIAFNLRGDIIATRYLHEDLRKVATVTT